MKKDGFEKMTADFLSKIAQPHDSFFASSDGLSVDAKVFDLSKVEMKNGLQPSDSTQGPQRDSYRKYSNNQS